MPAFQSTRWAMCVLVLAVWLAAPGGVAAEDTPPADVRPPHPGWAAVEPELVWLETQLAMLDGWTAAAQSSQEHVEAYSLFFTAMYQAQVTFVARYGPTAVARDQLLASTQACLEVWRSLFTLAGLGGVNVESRCQGDRRDPYQGLLRTYSYLQEYALWMAEYYTWREVLSEERIDVILNRQARPLRRMAQQEMARVRRRYTVQVTALRR